MTVYEPDPIEDLLDAVAALAEYEKAGMNRWSDIYGDALENLLRAHQTYLNEERPELDMSPVALEARLKAVEATHGIWRTIPDEGET